MGLLIRCPNHSTEKLDMAFAKVQGLTRNNEECYLFHCETLVRLDEDCNLIRDIKEREEYKMKINDIKIKELKDTSIERALNESYIIATQGIKTEDLKVFEFDNGEKDFIVADNLDNAIGFYVGIVGENEVKECEITEIKDWHNIGVKEEQDEGSFKETTFLESAKEVYINGYTNPIYIASSCV